MKPPLNWSESAECNAARRSLSLSLSLTAVAAAAKRPTDRPNLTLPLPLQPTSLLTACEEERGVGERAGSSSSAVVAVHCELHWRTTWRYRCGWRNQLWSVFPRSLSQHQHIHFWAPMSFPRLADISDNHWLPGASFSSSIQREKERGRPGRQA